MKVKMSIFQKKNLRTLSSSLSHRLKDSVRKFFFWKILILTLIKNSFFWRFSTALIDNFAVIRSKKYPEHLIWAITILWILIILNWPFESASLPKNENISVCCYCAAVRFPTIPSWFTASSIESSSWKFWAVYIAPEKCWCSIYNQWLVQLNKLANSSFASTEWEWRRWII